MNLTPYSLPLKPGDIVRFYSAQAGKVKFHLCLTPCTDKLAARFLFINSKNRTQFDAVLKNSDFDCIGPTEDGVSCVSFSTLIPMSLETLETFDAEVIGRISADTARKIIEHVERLVEPPITGGEIRLIKISMASIK